MLCTKNIVSDVKEVSPVWVYAHYCNVPIEQFSGREFKINSVFQEEKTPSMSFYIRNGRYKFKDFSTGRSGDHIDLVEQLHKLSPGASRIKIVSDYNNWLLYNTAPDLNFQYTEPERYKVSDFTVRKWNLLDSEYWTAYNISSRLLEKYCVKPLERYTMSLDGYSFKVEKNYVYGYFKKDGTLYKIYQPYADQKFIKILSYIQGSEQLGKHPYMIYGSSMKDILSLKSFKLDINVRAPDSENTLMPEPIIQEDLANHKQVLVMFDIDDNGAGQRAAERYRELYNITPIYLCMGEKDLSDTVRKLGATRVKQVLVPLINRLIN